MTKVSIIIPCHNAERTLHDTLTSALAQTHQNVEIILVNDGSTDGTREVASRFRDPRVSVLEQVNKRAGAARNRGFDACSGDWVLFLDADDLIKEQHIEALLDAAIQGTARAQCVVSASPWRRLFPNGTLEPLKQRKTYRNMSGLDWLLTDWANDYMTQSAMFLLPRTLIEALGGWRPELSFGPNDDFEFYSRILARTDFVAFAEQACLLYRSAQPGSLSTLSHLSAVERKLDSLELGTSAVLSVSNDARTRSAVANLFQRFIYEHYPRFPKLLKRAERRVSVLGGSILTPLGPPGFHKLKGVFGWKVARRVQRLAEACGLNAAARQKSGEPF